MLRLEVQTKDISVRVPDEIWDRGVWTSSKLRGAVFGLVYGGVDCCDGCYFGAKARVLDDGEDEIAAG